MDRAGAGVKPVAVLFGTVPRRDTEEERAGRASWRRTRELRLERGGSSKMRKLWEQLDSSAFRGRGRLFLMGGSVGSRGGCGERWIGSPHSGVWSSDREHGQRCEVGSSHCVSVWKETYPLNTPWEHPSWRAIIMNAKST